MNQSNMPAGAASPEGGATSLEVAAWHLQALLAAIGNADSKIMFLSALNTAGMSALIGVAVASDPIVWLFGLGLSLSGFCIALGLGRLWAADVSQFPTPDEAFELARQAGQDYGSLVWQHFAVLQDAVDHADAYLRRSTQVMRLLLLATPTSLAVVVVTAMAAIG